MERNIRNIEDRAIVIEMSVTIEDMLSLLLSFILEIKNRQDSISLGTKSSGLSFNAKANLLLDMKYFEKEDRWKFQMFMEIRNQFAHNIKVETFLQCFEIVSGKEKLLKTYPGNNVSPSEEARLKSAVIELGFEIIHLSQKVIQIYGEEYRREKYLEGLCLATPALLNAFKNAMTPVTEESDIKQFLETLLNSVREQIKTAYAAGIEQKNAMIKECLPNSNIPDLIKSKSIRDYFSSEEIGNLDLKIADAEINLSF